VCAKCKIGTGVTRTALQSPLPMQVIYLHGFASSPASRKARFFQERFDALGVPFHAPALDAGDFRNLTLTGQMVLVENLLPAKGTLLMGSSLGGYLAALLASEHLEIDRLILLAPAFNLYERWTSQMTTQQLADWERDQEVPVFHYGAGREMPIGYQFIEDTKKYEPFPSFSQPALLFHGIGDTVVPIEFSGRYVETHPHVELIRMTSGHELTEVLEPIWQETERFLLEQFAP
jgi:uncharacterized protein